MSKSTYLLRYVRAAPRVPPIVGDEPGRFEITQE